MKPFVLRQAVPGSSNLLRSSWKHLTKPLAVTSYPPPQASRCATTPRFRARKNTKNLKRVADVDEAKEARRHGQYEYQPIALNELVALGFTTEPSSTHKYWVGDMMWHQEHRYSPQQTAARILEDRDDNFENRWRGRLEDVGLAGRAKETYAQMCYICGKSMVLGPNRVTGHYILEVGAHMSSIECAVVLCNIENKQSFDRSPSTTAMQLVAQAAEQPNQWKAQIVLAESLLVRKSDMDTLQKAKKLAEDAAHSTEAGDEFPFGIDVLPVDISPFLPAEQRRFDIVLVTSPWKLLVRIAKAEISLIEPRTKSPEYKNAEHDRDIKIETGAAKYGDPEALLECHDLPEPKLYSPDWVEMMTQAAMTGNPDACKQIGKYHLEIDGWYPTGRKLKTRKHSYGLDWLEMAACHHFEDPERMAKGLGNIALVCRENGMLKKGRQWLDRGTEHLNELSGQHPNLGLGHKWIENWTKRDPWNDDRYFKGGIYPHAQSVASYELGPPVLST